ncbi:MAG TPA: metal ABC transporter substrate-binding protein [Acidimicrobiales bacterium]|jgi:zinc/manganese transport system substrate-binding protein|nr:metal ABC transporter substrate-binding protein [Acidimicrobiales bacterium]
MRSYRLGLVLLPLVLAIGACGGGSAGGGASGEGGRASIVVTTNVLGDVVSSIVGDQAEVTTIMPVGANPHDFQASAQQAAAMRAADLLVVNGGGFEEGLEDVIDSAEDDGVHVFEAISAVEPLELTDGGTKADVHPGEGDAHADEGDAHGHQGVDPHFFTDPVRMIEAVRALTDEIVEHVEGVDADEIRRAADAYISKLERLDDDIETTISAIPENDRILVTNHEVFGYFAQRYGFEIVGTVIPAGSTSEGASAGALADLANTLRSRNVRAVFADASASNKLAEALAGEVGGKVEVVELYSESLGQRGSDGDTYIDMMRTNAERIAAALA